MVRVRANEAGRGGARAFTLVETVLAAALGAMVLVGLQSAVLIAAKAVPATGRATGAAAQAGALERLAHELSYATRITSSSATSITFTVADRTGDAAADTLTYAWGGVAGNPLVRTFNGVAETVLDDVRSLSFEVATRTAAGGEVYIESGETLLASYSASSGLTTADITTASWVGQVLPVSLPSDAVDFRLTRARVRMGPSGAVNGTSAVEVRLVRNGVPSARVVAQATVAEPSSWGLVSCNIPSARYLDPDEALAMVVRFASNSASCAVQYRASGVPSADWPLLTSADGGASWASDTDGGLVGELWGVYRTLDDPASVTKASSVVVSLASGGVGKTQLHVVLAARPEVGP